MLIKMIDDIMSRELRECRSSSSMIFLIDIPGDWQDKHLQWFDSKRLRYEFAAPNGWLEGDPSIFAVYFNGCHDPLVAEYSAVFEEADGKSHDPDAYQLSILPYDRWLAGNGGP